MVILIKYKHEWELTTFKVHNHEQMILRLDNMRLSDIYNTEMRANNISISTFW
jgi:hypothetical protein